jgi:hypothetical protein
MLVWRGVSPRGSQLNLHVLHAVRQVIQPSGIRRTLPATAPPGGGRFVTTVAWHEAGPHSVGVLLGGVPVQGVPMNVDVAPGAVEPKLCTLHGKALSGVKCWDDNEISLHVKDR